MKNIKNKRAFASGTISTILALICLGLIIINGFQTRFVISLIILISWSMLNYFTAFTNKSVDEQINEYDERDRYIAQRSSHKTLLISNYSLFGGCLLGILFYGIFKNPVFLTISMTLCGVLIMMLIILIFSNIWFEKNN